MHRSQSVGHNTKSYTDTSEALITEQFYVVPLSLQDITPLAKALDLEVTLTEKCNGISPQRRSPSPSYVSHVVELHGKSYLFSYDSRELRGKPLRVRLRIFLLKLIRLGCSTY